MLARILGLACAGMMLIGVAACDGSALTGPDETTDAPLARTACMAGGDVAVRAGCPDSQEGDVSLERRPRRMFW